MTLREQTASTHSDGILMLFLKNLIKSIKKKSGHSFINNLLPATCFGFLSRLQQNEQLLYELYITTLCFFLCCLNFEVGEVFGILILANFGIILFRRNVYLKYMLVLQLYHFLFKCWYWWMCAGLAFTVFKQGIAIYSSYHNCVFSLKKAYKAETCC
jgi:hypothetical protein